MYPTRVELMLSLKKRLAGLNSAVALLVLAAAGGLSFTIGAGVLLYRNTQKLVSAADWVHHTEEVIAALASRTEDTVVFSHYIAINVAAGAALGDDRVVVFRPDNCSVTIMDTENGKLRLVERGHEAETKVN